MEVSLFPNPFDKVKYPNCWEGHQYAVDVVTRVIPSCVYIIGACKRYLKDIESAYDDFEYPYYFDPDKAEKYLRLVQKFEHVEGHWPTKLIIYEPWQKFGWMNIEGFRRKDTNDIKFRTVHWEVARGNAKSSQASQCALYHLRLDDPNGNHVYCAATKREQARVVLDSARAMANKNKSFLEKLGVNVLAHQIIHEETNSYVRSVSSDSSSLDGLKGKLIICDELHAMKRETFETLDSGQSKRRDSLLLCITTAGYDTTGVGHSQSAYAKKVALGDIQDETFFSLVYTIDREGVYNVRGELIEFKKDDDYFSETTWRKANPGFGTIVDPVNFAAKAQKAKDNPQDLNGFLIKHLDIWTNSASPFFNVSKWDEAARPDLDMSRFLGKRCWAAIDLASKIDLASMVFIFEEAGKFYFFDKTYLPEATIESSRNDNYRTWVRNGVLISTPGEAINYPKMQEDFKHLSKQHRIIGAMYDPWNASEFATRMTAERIEMIEINMNVSNLSEPMKKLDALIREGKFIHNGSPLLRWCLGNVVAKRDHNDNVFPRKEHEDNKIDPILAAILAMAGWISQEEKKSVYNERGMRFI